MCEYKLFNGLVVFSVWGDNPLYAEGIKANIELAKVHYPGWKVRVYTDKPRGLDCEEIIKGPSRGSEGMFWRFEAAADPNYHYIIFRDADSRLNAREAAAVTAWIESGKSLHIMRDHPDHKNWPILGGMWGIKGGVLTGIKKAMQLWLGPRMKNLARVLEQQAKKDHDRREQRLARRDELIAKSGVSRKPRLFRQPSMAQHKARYAKFYTVPKMADMHFLAEVIYPLFFNQYGTPSCDENGNPCQKWDVIAHDSQNDPKGGVLPFPKHEPYPGFVGEIVEAA